MKFFLTLMISSLSWGQSLTLKVVPPPKAINWSSPRTLLWSSLRNRFSFSGRPYGHVYIETNCPETAGTYTLKSKVQNVFGPIFLEGTGLSVFAKNFEGYFDRNENLSKEVADYAKDVTVAIWEIRISAQQCQRLSDYLRVFEERKMGKNFGLRNRPLYGEGGNSASFAASTLEVLDFMDQEIRDAWITSVNVPTKFAGPPLTNNSVSFLAVLMKAKTWAAGTEDHKVLTFWDLDKMYNWIRLKAGGGTGFRSDRSHFPVPKGPIWKTDQL